MGKALEIIIQKKLQINPIIIDELKMFNISIYNENGEFDYPTLVFDCRKTYEKLSDKNLDSYDKKLFLEYLATLQTMVGIRRMVEFIDLIFK